MINKSTLGISTMPDSALCRVCLADNIRMYAISNTRYQEMFEKLTGETVCNSLFESLGIKFGVPFNKITSITLKPKGMILVPSDKVLKNQATHLYIIFKFL